MRIATFNANSIRSRLAVILAWLEKHAPDVLCVQETKAPDDAFPRAEIEAAGYHVVFKGEKSYNGVALLAREAPRDVHMGFDDGGPPDETRLLRATVGRVHIVNTYVPQGRDLDHAMFAYKLQWFARLKAYFQAHVSPRARVAWLGDVNVAQEAIDVHNAPMQTQHVCYHASVRTAFAETAAWGFVDVFRQRHPEPGHYTFFDYRTKDALRRNMGWRIDVIMATPPLARTLKDAFIDREPRASPGASDHTFMVADFDL